MGRKRGRNFITSTFSLRPEQVEWLEKEALKEGLSVSEVLRKVVDKVREEGED